jgi:hypothetical protein
MAEEDLSTAQNTQWAKTFAAGAQYAKAGGKDGDGFVKFDEAAWRAWDTAIQTFIEDLDNVTKKFEGYGRWGYGDHGRLAGSNLISAEKTRTLLQETMPEEAKDSIAKYREYLVELQKGIKTAYERLNDVDQR